MIPVKKIKKPLYFDKTINVPGKAWLLANPDAKRPSPLWSACTSDLSTGFMRLCGYAAMLDPTGGTVDHYLSFKNRPDLAYEWDNYRFSSNTLNSSKKAVDDKVLDPFEVGAGWFEIILPSLQLVVSANVPAKYKDKAEFTLKRLKLRDGERIIGWRQSWYQMYEEGKLTLEGLRQVAPLIAIAVEKNTP